MRGIKVLNKKRDELFFCIKNKFVLCGFVEIKIKLENYFKICKKMFFSWNYFINYNSFFSGRVCIIWNDDVFGVEIKFELNWIVVCKVIVRDQGWVFFVFYLYGFNFKELR